MSPIRGRAGRFAAVIAAALLALPASPADEGHASAPDGWPQYRGGHRDGIARGGLPASSWGEAGPRVAWRRPLGSAFSQLAVHGEAAFTCASDDAKEYALRLDAATGKETWRTAIGDVFVSEFGNGPRATPTVDGERLFVLGAQGNLVALRTSDGSPLWSASLPERFGAKVPRFGYSGSPLVVDDLLLVEVGGEDGASLAALDAATGATRWSALSGPAGYGSPIVVEFGGQRQIVLVRGKTVTALGLDGKLLWTHELEEPAIAMPVDAGAGRIFISSMGDAGCAMLRMRKTETGLDVEPLWQNRNMRNHFNSSVVVDGHIYGFDNATLKCISIETGDLLWAKRGLGKGSLIASGKHLIVLSDKGKLVLAEASPEGYRESAVFQALEGKSWTAPSLAGGRLFLRNLTETTCLDLRS